MDAGKDETSKRVFVKLDRSEREEKDYTRYAFATGKPYRANTCDTRPDKVKD